MATASVVRINPNHAPVVGVSTISSESVAELQRVMQENHDKHHAYFNDQGFHNHIGHHLVTVYAMGATPEQLRHHFAHNAGYQRALVPEHSEQVAKLKDPQVFIAALGKHSSYNDFLNFFSQELSNKGLGSTLDEYVFKGDERAEAMFTRLFSSIVHPIIHLGLAIEFDITAMMAEGLAWTATHEDEVGDILRRAERLAKATPAPSPLPSVRSLFHDLQTPSVRSGTSATDFYKAFGRYNRAEDEIAQVLQRYRVPHDQAADRLHEAMNAIAYMALAIQRPPYEPKGDFFTVHYLNGTVFLPALLRLLSPANFARVLEAYVRTTLACYTAMAAPDMDIEYTLSFAHDAARRAKQGGGDYPTWESVYAKGADLDDDGHVSKALRALKGVEQVAGLQTAWEEPLKKADLLPLAGVLMRSVENEPDSVTMRGPSHQWVRGCGFEENWTIARKL